MGELLYLIIGIAVLAVLLLVGLLARARRGGPAAPPGADTDVIAPPAERPVM